MKILQDEYGNLSPVKATFFGGIAFSVLIALLIMSPFVVVNAGHRGVIVNLGSVSDRILPEGFHLVSPLADVEEIEVRTQKLEVVAFAASKDLQEVETKVAINFELNPNKINLLFKEIGQDYIERILAPAIQESTKSATAQYTAEELVVKRDELKNKLMNLLASRVGKYYIKISDVNIVNFGFSDEYTRAIEAKQTAKQNALRAEADLQKVRAEAEQRVAQAQAEAEAIRLQSNAANSENYVRLKALEVQNEAIKKWNGQLPQQFIPDSTLPFLNLGK